MNVLIDTSVWSQVLRRSGNRTHVHDSVQKLIAESKVAIIGPIRLELLSGISDIVVFQRLKEKLSSFPDLEIRQSDYETAAQYYNLCRSMGIQGSHIDFLICAIAHSNELEIFTLDKDFENYQAILPIRLFVST